MHRLAKLLFIVCAGVILVSQSAVAVTMTWSPVGNPGNASDPTDGDAFTLGVQNFGAVSYAYSVSTNDVTANQYLEFLNAKDPNGLNALGLYDINMSNVTYGEINYTAGNLAGSKYSVIAGRGDHPVNYVNWYDAARFANWLNNGGVSSSDTETGAYALGALGPGGVPVTPPVTHNAGALIRLPTEDEWYKAAYYNSGNTSYFQYPTSSNTTPTASGPTATANSANFNNAVGNLTNVGSYTGTTSPSGALDMGGNVFQWNDTLMSNGFRGARGGSYDLVPFSLQSSFRFNGEPTSGNNFFGFRLVSVPEPSTEMLAILACGMIWWWRKGKK